MGKLLHLTVKKKWFDLIKSGTKREEYRELKEYWHQRFGRYVDRELPWDMVVFRNGYQADAPIIVLKLESITIGESKREWADAVYPCYVLKLGDIEDIEGLAEQLTSAIKVVKCQNYATNS